LATNTSALSVTGIARATHCPERVLGLHFFNPVHRMELVEVIRGRCTSEDTVARVAAFVRDIGKVPVVVRDSPGFLLNRILMPQIAEAVRLFEQGADIAKIDRAMRDYGMPMGPLRLLDEVGLDVALSVARILAGAFGERLAVPATLERMIDAGMLGRKTGRGFYVYRGELAVPNHVAERWRVGDGMACLSSAALQRRLELMLLNEAARCVEENVVATHGEVDLAMVLGAGFAPFHGGPLRRIDALGPRAVVEELIDLTGIDPRFAPCALLQSMSAAGDLFYNRKEAADARR
jgi:3-hydroxyacyl-CoA dehydrogenase/enoyl-CoA hydratase/3-hydroxybutyryl-CoA epimerase